MLLIAHRPFDLPCDPIARKRCRVHRIPCPTSVTIAKRPSVWDGMGLLYYCFYQTGKRNIFDAGTGHDIGRTACRANHPDRSASADRADLSVRGVADAVRDT